MVSPSNDPYTAAQAASWDGYYGSEATGKSILYRRRLALALELLDQHLRPSDGPVADLGCGAGQLTAELVERGCAVTALDYSAEMLRLTEQKFAADKKSGCAVKFICADLNHHELQPAHFSAVCALGCLEFLNDVPGAITRICAGVRPGGYFLLSMPNVRSPFVWPEKLARRLLQLRRSNRPAAHQPLSLPRTQALMQDNGFTLVAARHTFPATFFGGFCFPPTFVLRHLVRKQNCSGARLLGNTWVALFRKMVYQ